MQTESHTEPVRKIARIAGKAGQAQQLRAALATLEQHIRREAGCLQFSFYQSISDENAFVLIEHFASQAALHDHLQLPHTRAFFAAQLVDSVEAVDVPSLGGSAS